MLFAIGHAVTLGEHDASVLHERDRGANGPTAGDLGANHAIHERFDGTVRKGQCRMQARCTRRQ